MAGFRAPEIPRDQITLWAERLDDAVPACHAVRLLDELFRSKPFVEAFAELEAAQRQVEGQPAYSPAALAKLYLYGQLRRIRSSRRLEEACCCLLDVIWLMEGLKPDHTTIARFLQRHRTRVRTLLKAAIKQAAEAGLVTLEMVAGDGTFVEANASRKSVKKKEEIIAELANLDEMIETMMCQYEQADATEDVAAEAGMLATVDQSLPEDQQRAMFERKRERLREALAAIEARENASRRADLPAPKPIGSVTDPDSRHMRDKENRRKPNYNVQLAVDAKAGMVVGATVSDDPNDMGQMVATLQEVRENCGQLPEKASFDAGFHTNRAVADVEGLGTEVYVTDPKVKGFRKAAEARALLTAGGSLSLQQIKDLPRDRKGRFDSVCFVYDEQRNAYRCPAGAFLVPSRRRTRSDRHGPIDGIEYATTACATCALASECHQSKVGRRITRGEFDAARERMLIRTMSEEGRQVSSQRSALVEPRIGEMKTNQELRKFLRRGAEKVRAELELVATAMNLGKLIRHAAANPSAVP